MPNRQSDLTSGYADPHSAVFSPKSTDPANLGINMCINILEGDNSPRVKDNIQNVTQHMQTLNIRVSRREKFQFNSQLNELVWFETTGNRQALPLF